MRVHYRVHDPDLDQLWTITEHIKEGESVRNVIENKLKTGFIIEIDKKHSVYFPPSSVIKVDIIKE